MSRCNEMNGKSKYPPEPDGPTTVFCKLFSDQVSEHLCMLRKKELDLKGGFSCEGCLMDTIIALRLQMASEAPGQPVIRMGDAEQRDAGSSHVR